MDQDSSQSCSDKDQGFEAQQIYIEKKKAQQEAAIRLNTDGANDLIDDLRPKDFLPRSIYKQLPLQPYPSELDVIHGFLEPQKLIPTIQQCNIKHKRYISLQQKYKDSAYSLVYNKFPSVDSEDYLRSYINLQKVVDYSELNFETFHSNENKQSQFDSNFESGNLLYAYKVDNEEYDLVLQNDTNTKGYNQWFYFSYEFTQVVETTFNIVSMIKKKTLFEKGVKPSFFVQDELVRWRQVTSSIKYYKNGVHRQNGESYYTLSFKYTPKSIGKVYFSLNLPYTYTKMINLLKQIQILSTEEFSIQKKTLCYSISNNAIPYLIFKSKYVTPQRQILFFARQHPGQTISSHIMQSLIKSLLTKYKLLLKFQILVVPMLNVDGVIYGNFRTNLAGYDINRQWKDTDKWMNPEVYALKKLIMKQPALEFVLDLHGHSKKFNSFIYACKQESKFQQKLFPFLMSRNSLFKIQSCTYGLTKDKASTARAFVKQLGIQHIYTLETSFYGYGSQNIYHRFESKHFDSLGETIILAIEQLYFSKTEQLSKYETEINNIIQKQDKESENVSVDSGSDSNPSQDELSDNQRQKHVIPAQVLKEKKFKQIRKTSKNVKKQLNHIRILQKEKRNSSVQMSNRQLHSSQKYDFRRTFESGRPNRTTKTTVHKTIEEKPYKTATKLMESMERDESDRLKKSILNKKKPKQVRPIIINKKEQKKEERETVSNLFLSSIRRSNVKPKRLNKSLIEQRQTYSQKQQVQSNFMTEKQKEQPNYKPQQQLTSMMAEMKNNLKQLSKLDKIVEQRIRQKMSQNLASNMPKMRRSQNNTGICVLQPQSNLLQLRQRLGNTILLDPTKQDQRQESNQRSRKSRHNKSKKELIFLSQLMRPKVENCKNYQIQVIGSNSGRTPNKNRCVLYFNQYL